MNSKVVFCSAVLLGLIGCTFAVKCYDCTYVAGTEAGKDCADPFMKKDSIGQTSCSGECIKTTSKKDGEVISVTRACIPLCVNLDCVKESTTGIEACVNCCTGDLCNGAGLVTFNLVAVAAMMVAALALCHH